ncbi:MAG: glycerophosphoryl diester phosphodiesterase [Bacteroidota bacterium]|nr:glycerophosphoryl diester phosphodiesterase [Bacteroidota bacterium]
MGCKKDPPGFTIDNLNDGKIGCFGHAGMGFYSSYPVNSWPGFESCLARGADGTEMDIHMTRDSVLVITHSSDLKETTTCSGAISDLTWADITDCNLKSIFFKDAKLLSLDEFLQKLDNPKQYIFTWDIKFKEFNQTYYGVYSRAIQKVVIKNDLFGRVFIENPFGDFLHHLQMNGNGAKLFLLSDNFEEGMEEVLDRGLFGLSMHSKHISQEQVKKAHSQGIRITIYGVLTEKENYAAIEKCPDYIQTDNINYLVKVFGKFNRNNGFVHSITK